MYDNLNPKLPAKLVDVTPWVKTKVWPSRTMAPLTPIAVPPQERAIASQKTPPLKKIDFVIETFEKNFRAGCLI